MAPKAQIKRPSSAAMKRPAAPRALAQAAAKASANASAKTPNSIMKKPAGVRKAKTFSKLFPAEEPPRKVRCKGMAETSASAIQQKIMLEGLRALLLGLERRPDRRERCERMLAEHAPWLEVEFFRATDGKSDVIPNEEVAKTWNTKCNSLYGAYEDVMDKDGKLLHTAAEFADPGVHYEFSPGERGCAHSHRRMWQRVAEMQGPMLILEDDVQLDFERTDGSRMNGEVFKERLSLGMVEAGRRNADVLYLGWSGFRDGNYKHLRARGGKKSPVVRKAEYVWTTVAYVLWPAGAKKLLHRAQPMDQPVDNFMAWESREESLSSWVLLDSGDTDDTWAGGVVTQLDFDGDSDIKKSDGGDQGDDPTVYLARKPDQMEEDPKNAQEDLKQDARMELSLEDKAPENISQFEDCLEQDVRDKDGLQEDAAAKEDPEEEVPEEGVAEESAPDVAFAVNEDARDDLQEENVAVANASEGAVAEGADAEEDAPEESAEENAPEDAAAEKGGNEEEAPEEDAAGMEDHEEDAPQGDIVEKQAPVDVSAESKDSEEDVPEEDVAESTALEAEEVVEDVSMEDAVAQGVLLEVHREE